MVKVARFVALRSRTGAYGGPADSALRQSELMAESGYEVTLVSGVVGGDEPAKVVDTKVRFVESTARINIRGAGVKSLFSLRLMMDVIREARKADLIHVSMAREAAPIWVCLVSWAMRTPYIIQPHGMLTARAGMTQKLLDIAVKPLFRRAAAVIALTETEKNRLDTWCGRAVPRIVPIGNPSLVEQDATEAERVGEALFIARLEPRKRVLDLARAAVLLAERGSSVSVAIVGPDQGDLSELAPYVEAQPNLVYEGAIDPSLVTDRLAVCDVFVLPSFDEPWGNVLVTALCLGIPVVVTRSAALASLIQKYEAGIVVSDGDPGELAAAIDLLTGDRVARASAASGALHMRDAVFSSAIISSQLSRLYQWSTQKEVSAGVAIP